MFKIPELSPWLNSVLNKIFSNKEPEKQAEEVKEQRDKVIAENTKGIFYDEKAKKYRAGFQARYLKLDLGLYENVYEARRILGHVRQILKEEIGYDNVHLHAKEIERLCSLYRKAADNKGKEPSPRDILNIYD